MLDLRIVKRTHPAVLRDMSLHYSQPKGFVGRNICYRVSYGWHEYGTIVAGSATKHLPGRAQFYNDDIPPLENIVNNIFFHIERVNGAYPIREFLPTILVAWRKRAAYDWQRFYGDHVMAFESLVELPRLGTCYARDGWRETGITKGFTCKRTGGYGTDSWSGARVWDTVNLRPKRVMMRMA